MQTMRADAVIIGGGVIGASILYHLSARGMRCLLLEKGEAADGTSGKCDGNIQCGDTEPGVDKDFVLQGQRLFDIIAPKLDIDVSWRSETSLMVFENEEEAEAGRNFVAQQQANGIGIFFLDRKQLHECEPNLAEDLPGGCLFARDGRVNPLLLTISLIRQAVRTGSEIRERSAVLAISRDALSGLFTVSGADYEAVTPIVINAAGVYAPVIGEMLGVRIPIRPRQGQILVAESDAPLVSRTVTEFGYLMAKYGSGSWKRNVDPVTEENGVAMVVEPTEAGNFLIGSSRRFAGYDTTTSAEVLQALAGRMLRFFPCAADIHIIRSYAGLRPFTEDHRAIISATEVKGFYVAAGHEGGGITQSLITGQLMSEILLGEKTCVPEEAFSLKRFMSRG